MAGKSYRPKAACCLLRKYNLPLAAAIKTLCSGMAMHATLLVRIAVQGWDALQKCVGNTKHSLRSRWGTAARRYVVVLLTGKPHHHSA